MDLKSNSTESRATIDQTDPGHRAPLSVSVTVAAATAAVTSTSATGNNHKCCFRCEASSQICSPLAACPPAAAAYVIRSRVRTHCGFPFSDYSIGDVLNELNALIRRAIYTQAAVLGTFLSIANRYYIHLPIPLPLPEVFRKSTHTLVHSCFCSGDFATSPVP